MFNPSLWCQITVFFFFFFFNDTATTEIYTLSLHDALPSSTAPWRRADSARCRCPTLRPCCAVLRLRRWHGALGFPLPRRAVGRWSRPFCAASFLLSDLRPGWRIASSLGRALGAS